MVDLAATVWRDYATAGVPGSGANQPEKRLIRAWGGYVEAMIAGAAAGGAVTFQTLAAANANLNYAANQTAWVVLDSTAANNGIYQKQGASGSGSWLRVGDLPYSYIAAINAGAGSGNAIAAETNMPVPGSDGAALITLPIAAANTSSTVTVSFNGGTSLRIKTDTGADPAVAALTPGRIVLGVVSGGGTIFRIFSPDRILPFRGGWSSGTTYAAGDLAENSGSVWYSLIDGNLNNATSEGANWTLFIPGGTVSDGSVTRAKLSASVAGSIRASLYEFGAVDTTGVGDNSTTFQAAADSGLDVVVPPGTFRVNNEIGVSLSHTRFLGQGRGRTEIKTYSSGHAISVDSGLNGIEFIDFLLTRGNTPTSASQNGIHFIGLTERARIARVASEGHWHNFRLCTTSLSWTDHIFSDNAYGNGIYVTNEDAVAAGMQWEQTSPFSQRANGWGIKYASSYGTTANVASIFDLWTYANKSGGVLFQGQASHPMNGVRLLGGFSGEEGGDSVYIDTYGTVDIQVQGIQTEINGTSSVGVNNGTSATGVGRGFTITANNTSLFMNGNTALGHSYCGIVSSCPRAVITGNAVRTNGAAAVSGERSGILIQAGRATVVGNSSLAQQFGIYFQVDGQIIVGNDVSEGNTTPIGGAATPTTSLIRSNLGARSLGAENTGWTTGTGTAAKGTYATYGGQTVPATPTQASVQQIDNALVNTSQRLLAIEKVLRAAGDIN